MDKIVFARLIAYLSALTHHSYDEFEIRQIDDLVSRAPAPSVGNVRNLLYAMSNDRKIEAIKEFRTLTGDGLKESKEAVERVMDKMKLDHPQVA